MNQPASRLALLGATAFLASACMTLPEARVPMAVVSYPAEVEVEEVPEHLVVLLPGIRDSVEAFDENGFVAHALGSDFADDGSFDVVAVDAHFGYYANRSIIDRLREDVIEPAQEAGYEQIHLVGISLGGFGSLLYLRKHPEHIATATLIAPYLGEEEEFRYVLDDSVRAPEVVDGKNLWPWILSMPDETRDKITLGFGTKDSFAPGNRLLGSYLVPGNTVTSKGGHEWSVWRDLWPELFARLQERMAGEES